MSAVDDIKSRLQFVGTPFAVVMGATDLAQVTDRPLALPAAFVLVVKEVTGENQRATGPVLQRVERDVMVVIVCEDLGDADGDAVQDQLETLKAFTRGRLVGFVASDMEEPITHVAGEVTEARAGCVWFQDTYSAPTYIREVI